LLCRTPLTARPKTSILRRKVASIAAVAPWLQKWLDTALSAKEQSELDREIERLIAGAGIEAEGLDRLMEILRKYKIGEPLTKEEREEIEKILKQWCPNVVGRRQHN
jgi:hypothetical protein